MKKTLKFLLSLTAFAMVAGAGFGLTATLNNNQIAEKADAADLNIAIAGDFNGWSTTPNLTKVNDNEYGARFTIDSDKTTFKIVKNSSSWFGVENVNKGDAEFDSYANGEGPGKLQSGWGNANLTLKNSTNNLVYVHYFNSYSDYPDGAIFIRQTPHTITFDSDGGSSVSNQSLFTGENIVDPGTPTKDGYIFDGWYYNNTVKMTFPYQYNDNSNVTVKAHWIEDIDDGYYLSGHFIYNGVEHNNFTLSEGVFMPYVDVDTFYELDQVTIKDDWEVRTYKVENHKYYWMNLTTWNIFAEQQNQFNISKSGDNLKFSQEGIYKIRTNNGYLDATLESTVKNYISLDNGVTFIELTRNEIEPEEGIIAEWYNLTSQEITAGTKVTPYFSSDGGTTKKTLIGSTVDIDPYNNNLDTDFKILQNVTEGHVYVKLRSNHNYFVWVNGSSYSVSFEPNGGTLVDPITEYKAGVVTQLPSETGQNNKNIVQKTGYQLVGWHEEEDLSDEPVTSIGVMAQGDKTFYAEWANIKTTANYSPGAHGTGTCEPDPIETNVQYTFQPYPYTLEPGWMFTNYFVTDRGTGLTFNSQPGNTYTPSGSLTISCQYEYRYQASNVHVDPTIDPTTYKFNKPTSSGTSAICLQQNITFLPGDTLRAFDRMVNEGQSAKVFNCTIDPKSDGLWSHNVGNMTVVCNETEATTFDAQLTVLANGTGVWKFTYANDPTGAHKFAINFCGKLHATCKMAGNTNLSDLIDMWEYLSNKKLSALLEQPCWGDLTSGAQDCFSLNAEVTDDMIADAIELYDYIFEKYGATLELEDFMGRFPNGAPTNTMSFNSLFTDFTDGSSNNPTLIILISCVVTGLAIGGYFLLRRKKED